MYLQISTTTVVFTINYRTLTVNFTLFFYINEISGIIFPNGIDYKKFQHNSGLTNKNVTLTRHPHFRYHHLQLRKIRRRRADLLGIRHLRNAANL